MTRQRIVYAPHAAVFWHVRTMKYKSEYGVCPAWWVELHKDETGHVVQCCECAYGGDVA